MKNTIWILVMFLMVSQLSAQKFITKTGYIKFYSETPMETILGENKQVNAAYDHESAAFVFKVLMKSFDFEKALMQEHFNENYVESDAFPVAIFKGKILNNEAIDLSKNGFIDVQVKGDLTIHGVTKSIETTGSMEILDGKITAKSVFMVKPSDYDIKIPGAVVKNIAEQIEVTVDVELQKLEK